MLIYSSNGNSYCYDQENKRLVYLHPLIIQINKMENNGENISIKILKDLFPQYTRKEICYYFKKFDHLKHEIRHIPFDTNRHNLRINPQNIIRQLTNVQQIVFEVTDKCNLRCHYCGYGGLYDFYDNRQGANLSFKKAKMLIDYLCELWSSPMYTSFNKKVYISFYGGEPLLNMKLIKEIISYIQSKSLSHIRFVYTMTTNAVCLEKEIPFLVKQNVHPLISLDGSANNNSYRTFKNNKNSFDLVYKNLKYVQTTYPDYFKNNVGFNAVLHNRNSVKDIFNFITSEFNKMPQIGELNMMGVREDKRKEFMQTYRNTVESLYQSENYSEIEKEMLVNLPKGKNLTHFLHQYTDNVYKTYSDFFIDKKRYQYLPTGTCFPFSRKLFVTTSGKILACERIPHEFSLGQVYDDRLDLDFQKISDKYNSYFDKMKNQCSKCYRKDGCLQCIFYIKNLDKAPICEGFFTIKNLQLQIGEAVTCLENETNLYSRIMKKVTIR